MAIDNLDLGLDDIIKQNKANKTSSNGGGSGRVVKGGVGGGLKKKANGVVGGGRKNGPSKGGVGGRRNGENLGLKMKENVKLSRKFNMKVADPLRRTKQRTTKKNPRQAPVATRALQQHAKKLMENKPIRLILSNLAQGVTDVDLQELFGEYGELVRAHINYDRSGSSLGSADVVFKRKVDAVNAFKEYRGVNLDGNKMDIMFALDEVDFFGQSRMNGKAAIQQKQGKLPNRVNKIKESGQIVGQSGGRKARGGRNRGVTGVAKQAGIAKKAGVAKQAGVARPAKQQNTTGKNVPKNSQKSHLGNKKSGGRQKWKAVKKPVPTAEDLDKQLDDYRKMDEL